MSTSKPEPLDPNSPAKNLTPKNSQDQLKESLLQEIYAIEYLLKEAPAWRANSLISYSTEQEFFRFYGTRRYNLLQAFSTQSKQQTQTDTIIANSLANTSREQIGQTTNAIEHNTFVIKAEGQATNQAEEELILEPNLAENIPSSIAITPMPLPIPQNSVSPRQISSSNSFNQNQSTSSQRSSFTSFSSYTETPPQKSLGELVSENINYIFAACGALFVGGVALYYRNELYHGLSQPIVQAAILMIVTFGFLVGGIFLVRQTNQALVGRTLTLVGSLLVPINPWFLVKSGLIANSGRAWILGVACTLLYASLVYFLKDSLFIYLSLIAGMLTTWVGVHHFSGNTSYLSSYATALLVYSIIALLAEQFFSAKEGDFTREKFGKPFFHFAQIGIALTLLFYTPLVAFLPREFVATKMHFDPSYNGLVTVWLALAGAFAYGYSARLRHASYFVYLSIAALYWSEISLFIYLKSSPGQGLLVIAITTLIIGVITKQLSLETLYSEPVALLSKAIGYSYICLAATILVLGVEISWALILAFVVVALMFQLGLVEQKENLVSSQLGVLLLSSYVLSLTKLTLDKDLFLLLLPLPLFASLVLCYLVAKSKKDGLSASLEQIALFCIGVSIYKLTQLSIAKDFSYLVLAFFWLEISLGFAALSYLVKKEVHALVSAIVSVGILTLSYGLALAHFDYLEKSNSILAFAILAFAYYGLSQRGLIWNVMTRALSYVSTSLIGLLLFISSILVTEALFNQPKISKYSFVAVALCVITVKEFWHLWKERNILHSVLLGISGVVGLPLILGQLTTNSQHIFLAEIILAIGYLLVAYKLTQENIQQIPESFEVLANLAVIPNAVALLAFGYNSSLDSFSAVTCLGYLVITFFYILATQLSEKPNQIKGYGYISFSILLVSICLFAYNFGMHNWADLSALLIPVLIGYLFMDRLLENSKFSNASIMVAQVAQPLVVLLGIISGLSRNNPPVNGAIFFAEITLFYLYLGLLKTQTYALYTSIITSTISLWKLLDHCDIEYSYFTVLYAFYGVVLLYISEKIKNKYAWVNVTIRNCAHSILGLSATVLILQTFASLGLSNYKITPYIPALLVMLCIFSFISMMTKDARLKSIYKHSSYVLAGVAYLTIGIRLGFNLLKESEFYTLPFAGFMLWMGYTAKRKSEDSADIYLSFGGVLAILPTLLHVMHYRFVIASSSSGYDFLLIIVSLALMLGGTLLQAKSVSKIGQAGFVSALAIIVFSSVNWEQQGLSVLMILLAIGVSVGAWVIHNRYKNLQELQREAESNRFKIHQ